MKKTYTFLLAFVAIFALASWNFISQKPVHEGHFHVGMKAPMKDYEMKGINGKSYTLDNTKGKNGLLVVFSCNTCPFVVGSDDFAGWEKMYNDLHKKAEELGIGMLLINSNEAKRDGDDSMEKMIEHAKNKTYSMPYVIDVNSQLANAFEAKTTPHVYLMDANLKLIYTGAIDNSYDPKRKSEENYLLDAFANVSTGENVKVSTTTPRGCSIKRLK
jgi:glutathione peroxidase-family protein